MIEKNGGIDVNKTVFRLLCAIIIGIIAGTGYLLQQNINEHTMHIPHALTLGLLVLVVCVVISIPTIYKRLQHICCDLDWAEETSHFYQSISPIYRKSFWLLFGFINLAFLFHTINFMWGAGDWAAVRTMVNPDETLSDGRFSAYWLQELLFDGKILPVANNLWAFFGLSLAGVLLSIYWNLPKKTSIIVITGLFFSITPYTLSWLYSTKNTLGSLWLPAIALSALLLANQKTSSTNRSYLYNLISVLLFLFALGSFLPIINFIAIAILGRVLIQFLTSNLSLKEAFVQTCQSLANFTAGLMFYLLILFLLNENGTLRETTLIAPLSAYLSKIPEIFTSIFTTLTTPSPFIDIVYKSLFLLILIMSLFTIIFKAKTPKTALKGLLLVPVILIAGKLSSICTFDPMYQAEYTDFYSIPLTNTLMLSLLLLLGGEYIKRLAYILSIILIFMGFVRVSYAQKVWKLGWDAETKLAERIITELEKKKEFDINHKYKLLQIGEVSLRSKYYQKTPNEQHSLWLLDKPYYPSGASKDAYNFYYQTDFLENDALEEAAFLPEIRDYLLNKARAWPSPQSILISGNYIVLVLDEQSLADIQQKLFHFDNDF